MLRIFRFDPLVAQLTLLGAADPPAAIQGGLELFAAVGAVKLPVVVVEWFGLCWATVPPIPVPPVPVRVPAFVVFDCIEVPRNDCGVFLFPPG
jgi:hypothetical protein